jgi:M6 family metalloprotease-like protein
MTKRTRILATLALGIASVLALSSVGVAGPMQNRNPDFTASKAEQLLSANRCKLTPSDESHFEVRKNNRSQPYSGNGKQKHYFAFVGFRDYLPPESPRQIMERIGNHAPSFFKKNSYGKLRIQIYQNQDWVFLPRTGDSLQFLQGEGGFDSHLEAIRAGLAAINPEVDLSKYDGFHIVFGADPNLIKKGTAVWNSVKGMELVADGRKFSKVSTYTIGGLEDWGAKAPEVVTHELGHTFGIPDLYSYLDNTSEYSSIHRFVGHFDIMGFVAADSPSFLTWNRWRLGWLKNKQVVCLKRGVSTSVDLDPINLGSKNGKKLIAIRIDRKTRLVVEYRPLGTDPSQTRAGLLLYHSTDKAGGQGGIVVYSPSGDNWKADSLVEIGQKACVSGVCVSAENLNGSAVRVSVSPER